jgi:hypothetical protein
MAREDFESGANRETNPWHEWIPETDPVDVVVSRAPHDRAYPFVAAVRNSAIRRAHQCGALLIGFAL